MGRSSGSDARGENILEGPAADCLLHNTPAKTRKEHCYCDVRARVRINQGLVAKNKGEKMAHSFSLTKKLLKLIKSKTE